MTNQAWEDFKIKYPLARFSYYLNGRVWVLLEIRTEILENLEVTVVDDVGYHENMSRAEMLFWLWSFGAYEVIRTMHQAKLCFSQRVQDELFILKKELAIVRMPSAKMEKAGKNIPVPSGRSASGFDAIKKDLLVGDPNNQKSARALLNRFSEFILSLDDLDIISTHESTYENK